MPVFFFLSRSEIASILASIYNESLAKGIVTDDWRQACVSEVVFKGNQASRHSDNPLLKNRGSLQAVRTLFKPHGDLHSAQTHPMKM